MPQPSIAKMQIICRAIFLLSVLYCIHAPFAQHLTGSTHHPEESGGQTISNHTAKRNDCEPQLIGHGPRPDTDTPEEFKNFTTLFATARIASTPLGYRLVGQALNGSVYGKVFHGVEYLDEYNPDLCAEECNAILDCSSFNICTQLLRFG